MKKEKDEAYIRTCGVTQLVKGSDITKDIKDPLSLKYKEWSGSSFFLHFDIQTAFRFSYIPFQLSRSYNIYLHYFLHRRERQQKTATANAESR